MRIALRGSRRTDSPPFNRTWSGSDQDDGSFITVTLSQSGNSLTGTFADSFSGDVTPGHSGSGSGTVSSAATAQITFDMLRGDGRSVSAAFSLTLSDNDNTLTLGCDVGCPIVLQK